MEELEQMSNIANRWGRYQKIIGILMILTSCYIPIIVVVLPLNQLSFDFLFNGELYTRTNSTSSNSISYFCSSIYAEFDFIDLKDKTIIPSTSPKSWASDLKFVCSP